MPLLSSRDRPLGSTTLTRTTTLLSSAVVEAQICPPMGPLMAMSSSMGSLV